MDELKAQIIALQEAAQPLEPDKVQRMHIRDKVNHYSETFLDTIHEQNAWNDSETKGRGIYDAPISEHPEHIDQLLQLFEDEVDLPHLNAASGGHLGYVPGGGQYYAALGDFLADVTNNYSGVFYASPGAVRMENMLIRWMANMVNYPESAAGNLASGGSIANLIAIVTARDAHQLKGKDYERTVIYASRQMHHCLDKAIRIAGLSECIVRFLPLDDGYRIVPEKLEEMIEADQAAGLNPFLVIASAGTTDVGAIDPLEPIGNIAQKHNLWFHVDGAYGAFFMLLEEGQQKMKGIELSDSVVMDPHKGLFLPYGLGVVIVKKAEHLLQSHYYQANYMQDTKDFIEELSPAELSPELTKHFRGLRLWLPLKLCGVAPFRACLEEKLKLTQYFRREVANIEGIEVAPEPDLSITWFRYCPKEGDANAFNQQLIDNIRKDGRVFVSSTSLEGKFVIRFACLAFRTHLERVDLLLALIRKHIQILEKTVETA